MSSDVREFPSIIVPDKVVSIGDEVMEKTQTMNAVDDCCLLPTTEMPAVIEVKSTLTVKDIVSKLIEQHIEAWMSLPASMRNMMLEAPSRFELIFDGAAMENVPYIKYNDVVLMWIHRAVVWSLKYIER